MQAFLEYPAHGRRGKSTAGEFKDSYIEGYRSMRPYLEPWHSDRCA